MSENPKEIVDLDKVFLPVAGSKTKKIVRTASKPLTEAGDNYGSIMLSVDITVKDSETNEEETISTATKLVPKNEFIQEIFQSHITFRKEVEFYRTILPLLQDFQRSRGVEEVINFAPPLYGARLGLQSAEEYDTDALLILGNLKSEGFVNVDRTVGFDFETAKFIIRDLAQLHGVATGLKKVKPDVFNEKIKTLAIPTEMKADVTVEQIVQYNQPIMDQVAAECPEHMESFKKIYKVSLKNLLEHIEPREPWGTFVHRDFWVNNTMVKFEEGKIVDNKIVDFQLYCYQSPARDLIFFILTSVQNAVIEKHFDDLVDCYYDHFIGTLKSLKVDTEEFDKKSFLTELGLSVRETALYHVVQMLRPIFAVKKDVQAVEDIKMDTLFSNMTFTQEFKDKLRAVFAQCAKSEWV